MALATAAVIGVGALAATTAYLFTNIDDQSLDAVNNITQEAVNACSKTTLNQNITITDSTLYAKCAGGTGEVDITQTSAVEASCYLENLIDSASDFAVKLSNDQKTNLGMDINATKVDIQNILTQITVDYCGGASSTADVTLTGTTIIGCPITIAQNGSVRTQCSVQVLQQAIMTMAVQLESKQSSFGLTDLIVGIVVLCLVLGVVGFGLVLLVGMVGRSSKPKPTEPSTPATSPELATSDAPPSQKGGSGRDNSVLYALVILAILILVLIVIGWSTGKMDNNQREGKYTVKGWHRHRMLQEYIRENVVFKLNGKGAPDWNYYLQRYRERESMGVLEQKNTGCNCPPEKTHSVQHPESFVYGQPPPAKPAQHYSDFDNFSSLDLGDSLSPGVVCTRI